MIKFVFIWDKFREAANSEPTLVGSSDSSIEVSDLNTL